MTRGTAELCEVWVVLRVRLESREGRAGLQFRNPRRLRLIRHGRITFETPAYSAAEEKRCEEEHRDNGADCYPGNGAGWEATVGVRGLSNLWA